ncbi:TolC family protein [Fulvivirgaceae bacterium PWU5]|uniref:TolC family protein n=1 Tax=Dawidia cretensis TaxID=2782350 RepID=A0AAP2DX08_9BACT|nr:TolC family protein [Dawidia cretensis]
MLLSKREKRPLTLILLLVLLAPGMLFAQEQPQQQAVSDSLLQEATLEKIVQYALDHQPMVKQAQADQEIVEATIDGKLADWFPQINFVYNYQHNVDLPVSVIDGRAIQLGVDNTSSLQFTATQTLFNRDVLLASRTANKVRIQAEQQLGATKIDVVVNVSKAFYDVLATTQQIKIGQEDIIRLERSLKDAQAQYSAGVVDKTDYKRAQIQLTNGKATLKANQEALKYKLDYLRAMMGYPPNGTLNIQYDTLAMEGEIAMDTVQALSYSQHIDYKLLFTQRELQKANLKYAWWAFLPTLNAFGAYIANYQNNEFNELYAQRFPNSYFGATLTLPIFQGGKRNARIREQRWTLKKLDWNMVNLENNLTTEYSRALASYKSSLSTYLALKENVVLAEEVYSVIQLQYRSGIRPYLDVTIAETDLRSVRINYFNALYQVLAAKIDVQRALGQINY